MFDDNHRTIALARDFIVLCLSRMKCCGAVATSEIDARVWAQLDFPNP